LSDWDNCTPTVGIASMSRPRPHRHRNNLLQSVHDQESINVPIHAQQTTTPTSLIPAKTNPSSNCLLNVN
jgi:hypothetical protein